MIFRQRRAVAANYGSMRALPVKSWQTDWASTAAIFATLRTEPEAVLWICLSELPSYMMFPLDYLLFGKDTDRKAMKHTLEDVISTLTEFYQAL